MDIHLTNNPPLSPPKLTYQKSRSTNPECLPPTDDTTPTTTCKVDLKTHTFAQPNLAIPSDLRGVYWIDAGSEAPGYSNPWVDLNMLKPFPEGSGKDDSMWIMDATPLYQSWEWDKPESYDYVKTLMKLGTRSEVDINDLTVTWSSCGLTCGSKYEFFVPLPVSSPSQKVGPNEYVRQAKVLGFTVAEWKGYRIVDGDGVKTEFFEKMVGHMVDGQAIMIPE